MTVRKWYKRDVKFLRRQLDSFVLVNRMYQATELIRRAVESSRAPIVVSNATGFRNMLAERAKENRETAEHARAHPTVHGSMTDEIIERFTRLAEECDRDVARIDGLLARVREEGLPDDVASYLPEGLDE